jgi:hypothetical protein
LQNVITSIPTPTLRSCGAITEISVDTTFKDWSPAKLDYTPVSESEKLQYLFYCPICMMHQESGAACSKCRHHICFDCAELMLLGTIKHDEMQCPHCREVATLDVIKCSEQIIRTYLESPRTIENQNLQRNKEAAATIARETVASVIETAALSFRRRVSNVSVEVGRVTMNELIA